MIEPVFQLHEAIKSNDMTTVKRLIDAGVDLNTMDCRGWSLLHHAAIGQSEAKMIALLLASGCQITKDYNGLLPMEYAVFNSGDESDQRLDVFFEHLQSTQWCAEEILSTLSFRVQNIAGLKKLLQLGLRLDKESATALLHHALDPVEPDLIAYLGELGADVNAPDERGISPIEKVIQHRCSVCLKHLIEQGADLNKTFLNGDGLPHIAMRHPDKDVLKVLMSQGLDWNLGNDCYESPLIVFSQQDGVINAVEILDLLKACGVDFNSCDVHGRRPLHYAVRFHQPERIKALVENGTDVNIADRWGITAAHTAAESHCQACLQILGEMGADFNIPDKFGQYPVQLALDHEFTDGIVSLREGGADMNVRGADGKTLAHHAVERGHRQFLAELAFEGADFDLTDDEGNTLLHQAIKSNQTACLEIIAEYMSNVDRINLRGQTPIDMVKDHFSESRRTEIIDCLEMQGCSSKTTHGAPCS